MEIENHLNKLYEKVPGLKSSYDKYIGFCMFTTFIKEFFFWALAYVDNMDIKWDKTTMIKFFICILVLYTMNIPLEKIQTNIKTKLVKTLAYNTNVHFHNVFNSFSKSKIQDFDIERFYNKLLSLEKDFHTFLELKNFYFSIPIKLVTLFIITYMKDRTTFLILFVVTPIMAGIINKIYYENEYISKKMEKNISVNQSSILQFMKSNRLFLINGKINNEYVYDNFKKLSKNIKQIEQQDNNIDFYIGIIIYIIVILVFLIKRNTLDYKDAILYFYIISNIEFLSSLVTKYYNDTKTISNFSDKLKYFSDIEKEAEDEDGKDGKETEDEEKVEDKKKDSDTKDEEKVEDKTKKLDKEKIYKIFINKLVNQKPELKIETPIILESSNDILLEGSGKSIFFNIIKGLYKPFILDITPSMKSIIPQTFITIPQTDKIYSGKLYDIITNYDENKDFNLITLCLKTTKLDQKFNPGENINIDVNKISSDENTRLKISRYIYDIKGSNYNILLFDKIDDNMSDSLALEVVNNIREIFKDKIIIFIAASKSVRESFKTKLSIDKSSGEIKITKTEEKK